MLQALAVMRLQHRPPRLAAETRLGCSIVQFDKGLTEALQPAVLNNTHSMRSCSLGTPWAFSTMAPNLAVSQHDLIRDMLLDGSLTSVDMAKIAGCSDRIIRNIATVLTFDCLAKRKPQQTALGDDDSLLHPCLPHSATD